VRYRGSQISDAMAEKLGPKTSIRAVARMAGRPTSG
jgi:hypothetical protein